MSEGAEEGSGKKKRPGLGGRVGLLIVVAVCNFILFLSYANDLNAFLALTRSEEKDDLSLWNQELNENQQALQLKVQEWLARNDTEKLPPHTPGAFLHIGKTGGSTLSQQLRYGCHSWVPKPCGRLGPRNESYVSKLTTYIHTPDFRLGGLKKPYDFYVITIRDPFSRTLSAFTYMHPWNGIQKPRVSKSLEPVFKCFPTLESFAQAVGDHPDDYHYPWPDTVVNNTNCTNLARAILHNKVHNGDHFFWDTKNILAHTPSIRDNNTTILAIRTENLWKDFTSANHWLGQPDPVAIFPEQKVRDYFSQQEMKVTKDISELGRKRLCRALVSEYQAYFKVIVSAVNLGPDDKQESLDLARKNCPYLNISLPHTRRS